jgi:hypothetical protein
MGAVPDRAEAHREPGQAGAGHARHRLGLRLAARRAARPAHPAEPLGAGAEPTHPCAGAVEEEGVGPRQAGELGQPDQLLIRRAEAVEEEDRPGLAGGGTGAAGRRGDQGGRAQGQGQDGREEAGSHGRRS